MRNLLLPAFVCFLILVTTNLPAQNVMINVLTQNAGLVKKEEAIFFEVSIHNTSAATAVPIYKLKPRISFPVNLVEIPATGHLLPKGWTIISNNKGVIVLSNGTDIIPVNGSRTILIKLKGREEGGPASIIANLGFSNGIAPGSATGNALPGDGMADNTSSSSIKVLN